MPVRPCRMPEDCLAAVDAQQTAREALETAGGALGDAAAARQEAAHARQEVATERKRIAQIDASVHQLVKDVKAIERRTRWQPLLQWSVPALVMFFGVVWPWLSSRKSDANTAQVASIASSAAVTVLNSRLPSTEATWLNGHTQGVKDTVDEQLRRLDAHPSPLNRAPDSIAARPKPR
jgi:hypothetical protein